MKKHISFIAVLLGTLVLLDGCNKTGLPGKGDLITFGTVSEGTRTKAAYGDDFTVGSDKYQAIDWEAGDIVRIISPEAEVSGDGSGLHWADYTVTEVNKQTDGTSAAVVNTNPNGLTWTDADSYSFYGVYPSTTPISLEEATYAQVSADFIPAEPALSATTDTKTVGDITYTVYTPDLSNAVMTAVATGVKESDEKPQVKLHFKPTWTAIEFNLSSLDEPAEITQIQLVADSENDDYLAGPFTMTAGDLSTAAFTTSSLSKTVTLATTSGTDGVTVTTTEGATFTMMLLPKANVKSLKFRVTSKEGDETKTSVVTLSFKNGDPLVLNAGEKYRINGFKVPGNYWKIFYAPDILDADKWGEPLGETNLIVE